MKIVILMTSGPKTPWRCASPFYISALMAANEADVEMFFNMDATRLLKKGIAQNLYAAEPNCLSNNKKLKTVYDFMKDAKMSGVRFYSCKQAIDSMGYNREELIEELDGIVPASEFAIRAMNADKVMIF
ncbi:MAG: DsrE/DsrF/DrsH-like family protein [Aquificaceae bacterium]